MSEVLYAGVRELVGRLREARRFRLARVLDDAMRAGATGGEIYGLIGGALARIRRDPWVPEPIRASITPLQKVVAGYWGWATLEPPSMPMPRPRFSKWKKFWIQHRDGRVQSLARAWPLVPLLDELDGAERDDEVCAWNLDGGFVAVTPGYVVRFGSTDAGIRDRLARGVSKTLALEALQRLVAGEYDKLWHSTVREDLL